MASEVTTEQFSLRWNNFHTNLKSGFHDLLQQAEMVDVTLAVDGHFLQAHKVVLSICSPYFKQMFKNHPCKHPIVILKDVGHENMKDILQFMYMGEVSVLRENLSCFLRTAEVLQVKGLTGEDSSDDRLKKDEKKDTSLEEENELYSQLIETTSDVDVAPPQTSPLPLNCPKKQPKSSSPTHPCKKIKTEYSSPYNLESEMPKNVDYHQSCDFAQNLAAEPEEAKDYSKSGTGLWKGGQPFSVTGGPSHPEASVGTSKTDQSTAEQETAICNVEDKGHVFCQYCYRKFVNRYNLKVHIRDKHESKSTDLDCQVCGKTMRNQSCLRVHMYHHRKQVETTGVGS